MLRLEAHRDQHSPRERGGEGRLTNHLALLRGIESRRGSTYSREQSRDLQIQLARIMLLVEPTEWLSAVQCHARDSSLAVDGDPNLHMAVINKPKSRTRNIRKPGSVRSAVCGNPPRLFHESFDPIRQVLECS